MKRATLMVEFVVEIPDAVDPNAITFDIPMEQVKPMDGDKVVGKLVSYTTQEYFGE